MFNSNGKDVLGIYITYIHSLFLGAVVWT